MTPNERKAKAREEAERILDRLPPEVAAYRHTREIAESILTYLERIDKDTFALNVLNDLVAAQKERIEKLEEGLKVSVKEFQNQAVREMLCSNETGQKLF